MRWLFREPERDPLLGQELRRLESFSTRDDTALRRQIVEAAGPRLTDLSSSAPRWWEWISRWTPIAVPVGVAAALLGAVLLPQTAELSESSTYAVETAADSTLVAAAYAGEGGGQLAAHLVAPEQGDWLLEAAVAQ